MLGKRREELNTESDGTSILPALTHPLIIPYEYFMCVCFNHPDLSPAADHGADTEQKERREREQEELEDRRRMKDTTDKHGGIKWRKVYGEQRTEKNKC